MLKYLILSLKDSSDKGYGDSGDLKARYEQICKQRDELVDTNHKLEKKLVVNGISIDGLSKKESWKVYLIGSENRKVA